MTIGGFGLVKEVIGHLELVIKKLNSVAWVRERTIPTERQSLVAWRIPTVVFSAFWTGKKGVSNPKNNCFYLAWNFKTELSEAHNCTHVLSHTVSVPAYLQDRHPQCCTSTDHVGPTAGISGLHFEGALIESLPEIPRSGWKFIVVFLSSYSEISGMRSEVGHDPFLPLHKKTELHGLSPRANYTDRATAASRRSDWQLLLIEGSTWSAWRIPTAVFLVF
jgi:hypothetical protein